MALKKNHPGCSTGVNCACDSACTLLYESISDGVPATLTDVDGTWTEDGGYLTTSDADAWIRTTAAHTSAGMRAEAKVRGSAPGDLLRVLVAAAADGSTYLAAELELGTCADGDGVLRLIEDGATVAEVVVAELVAETFHTLRVCYDEDTNTLAALVTPGVSLAGGTQGLTQRKLEATVTAAAGTYAGWATGGTLAGSAEFNNLAWYDDGDDCPSCTPTDFCAYLADYFYRSPREQADPGCNWTVTGAAPVTEVSEFVSVCTISDGATIDSRVEPESAVMRVTASVALAVGGSARIEIAKDGGDYLFARLSYDGFTLTTAVGEVIGGAENIVDTGAVVGSTGAHVVYLCYDGRLLILNIEGGPTGQAQGGVTDTTATGWAITAEAEPLAVYNASVSKRETTAGACTWCGLACAQCSDGVLPPSVLVSIESDGSGFDCAPDPVVLEALWYPTSIYNPTCGEFLVDWDVSDCVGYLAPVGQSPATVRVVYRLGEVFVQITGFWGTLLHKQSTAFNPECLAAYDLPFFSNSGAWLVILGNLTISVAPP